MANELPFLQDYELAGGDDDAIPYGVVEELHHEVLTTKPKAVRCC